MSERLSPETVRRIEALFPQNEWAMVSQLLLRECGNNLPLLERLDEFELERFRFAALKISEGRIDHLKEAIQLAQKDWRDLLMAAKFWTGESHKTWFPHSPSLKMGIVASDPQSTAAAWYLGSLNAEEVTEFARKALEEGRDGENLRRLAGLLKPTKRDVDGIVDGAFCELGVAAPLSKDEAALWTLGAVKSCTGSSEVTGLNLIGKMLVALPELEEPYVERLKSYGGQPGNYEAVFDYLRPALKEQIATGGHTDFLRRSSSFIEQVCNSGELEAINVLWIEIFEWLVHSPGGELKFLWPILGPSTKATIEEVARRRRETENLP